MSNFFAALEVDSDEEEAPQPRALKVSSLGGAPSTKDKRRQDHTKKETRNTKSGRGGRGGRAPSREGKRAYDRRSGTGRGKEIKKGGGGKRNWGSDKNDAKQAEGTIVEGDESEPRKVEEETPYVEEEEEEREPEIETVSYEEYMANKAKSDSQAFQPLKERKVQNEFAKVEAKKKTVTEDFLVMGEGKKDRKRGKNSKKQAIDLGFRVKSSDDPVDRKRDGGGRGRGRGGRGRGDGRGGRGDGRGRGGRSGRGRSGGRNSGRGGRSGGRTTNQLDMTNDAAFPSL